ncbi:YceI family protein [Compostibacter hankyongensis]|uniref:YceI family protein n=1 Tax=Compostibacter hankyongensis TaxID=1007089 RepID=A0ABP8G606_9BACT
MATKQWVSDPAHSEIQFKVKHLMVTNITGSFKQFSASAESSRDDFQDAKISFSADIASVDTGNEQRNGHLLAADFFDAEKFPQLSFVSTAFRKINDEGDYELDGNLTIKDVTKPVKLRAVGGAVTDPWGNVKTAFSVEGKINRTDWGLSYNAALETGGVLISEDVRILAEVQMTESK